MNDSLKIPCTKSFIEKYIVPIKHNIDLDSIEICKINNDGTLAEEVYGFKLIRDALPNIIIPTKQIKDQKYFIKYFYFFPYLNKYKKVIGVLFLLLK